MQTINAAPNSSVRTLRGVARRLTVALATQAVAIGFLSGCGLGTQASNGSALVRFVQVSPGSPELDFFVNGTGSAYGLGFESFTSYLPTSPGAATLSVHRTGRSRPLITSQVVLSGGHQYTALLGHGLGNLQQEIFLDQEWPAPAGRFALRVVNAVEGSPGLTISVVPDRTGVTAEPPTALYLVAGAESSYLQFPAGGSYRVSAVFSGSGVAGPLSTASMSADSGSVRTMVFAGTAVSAAHAHVVSFVLNDADPL